MGKVYQFQREAVSSRVLDTPTVAEMVTRTFYGTVLRQEHIRWLIQFMGPRFLILVEKKSGRALVNPLFVRAFLHKHREEDVADIRLKRRSFEAAKWTFWAMRVVREEISKYNLGGSGPSDIEVIIVGSFAVERGLLEPQKYEGKKFFSPFLEAYAQKRMVYANTPHEEVCARAYTALMRESTQARLPSS
ncbi:MAG: hypothetical protein AAB938_00340 [Patescibacteria group bacterium]